MMSYRKQKRRKHFLTHFSEFSITLILRLDEEITGKENRRPWSLMNIDAKTIKKILKN